MRNMTTSTAPSTPLLLTNAPPRQPHAQAVQTRSSPSSMPPNNNNDELSEEDGFRLLLSFFSFILTAVMLCVSAYSTDYPSRAPLFYMVGAVLSIILNRVDSLMKRGDECFWVLAKVAHDVLLVAIFIHGFW